MADNVDPSAKRQAERNAAADTFEAIAIEWLNLHKASWADETISILEGRVKAYLLPYLGGSRPVASIAAQELLGVLRRVEARGRNETAHRVRSLAGRILRLAVATGRASHDVAADLKDALAPVASRNFASVTDPVKVGELLRAIDGYSGQPITALALKLAPLVFVCPGELRGAEWSEFDLDNSQWRIPGPRMKMGDPHIVPLSSQAVEILKELERFTGTGKFVFPSLLSRDRPMSENTINAALRRMGYSGDDQTGHRFRSMASTLLNEQGFPPDVIELQLAHAERNKVRAAYNKAQRLAERRTMMQAWADYWISFGKADSGDIGVDTNLTKIPDPGRDTGRGRPNGSILSTVDTVQDMTMDAKLKDLPLDERIKLVEDLWDSIAADQNALPLTAEQKAELDRRLEAYEIDKNPGRLASEAIADIRRRL